MCRSPKGRAWGSRSTGSSSRPTASRIGTEQLATHRCEAVLPSMPIAAHPHRPIEGNGTLTMGRGARTGEEPPMTIHTRPEIDFSTFPDSDGEPMAETVANRIQMVDLIWAL